MSFGKKLREVAVRMVVRGFVKDVSKGKYGGEMQKVWNWLNGRKTAIGLLVTFLPELAARVGEIVEAGGGSADGLIAAAGYLAVAVGALHRVLKGSDAPAPAPSN